MRIKQATLQACQINYDNMSPYGDTLTCCILCGATFDGADWGSDTCEDCNLKVEPSDSTLILTNIPPSF